tara:strand:- start:136 stop:1089 length:954 start_codon:yes stop_codon:yes gene_type:complete
MKKEKKLETINHFFKVQSKSTDRCLEPNDNCDRKAIRSHSIPSGSILSSLSKDGHVIMPSMNLNYPPPSEIEFKEIGVNKATTFSGLCSNHDSEIFRPIDIDLPDTDNQEHLFLLAYRAVLREYHACLQNALRFQSTYQKRIDVDISPKNEPDSFGMYTTSHMANAYECYLYKREFDQYLLSSEWSKLKHHIIVLKNQAATIAVNSLFSLDDIEAPETPRVTLSIYPNNTDLIVVFSFTETDSLYVSNYLNRILNSEGYYQKYLLSKLILQSCENIVLSPDFFDSFSEDKKNAIGQFFIDTIFVTAQDYESEYLYLF